ncbi:hypothetical protein N0V90_005813 [Kalmusia sp. IMI 367209]|nr:hypothetical protein N0V90_005813 [Kalmusia sp. IMI 367209]
MAPLGILTAVVSAIRIRGNASLKAFIGRAQESAGTAELELLSSTSETVGELYNEGGVARVFGRPQILEVCCREATDDVAYSGEDKDGNFNYTANIELFSETENASWRIVKRSKMDGDVEERLVRAHLPPNLSLNIGVRRLHRRWYITTATFAVVIQTGTVLLCFGVFLCARIIEQSTDEVYYKQKDGSLSTIYWIQPGGQKIGDQVFGSFIGKSKRRSYIRSTRNTASAGEPQLWIAVTSSMIGFALQFIGLRAIHPSVTLAQLGSTLLMAIIRAGLRTQRMKSDHVLNDTKVPTNHELDFLSSYIGRVQQLSVSRSQKVELLESITPNQKLSPVSRSMKIRARLARLIEDDGGSAWKNLPARETALQLQTVIENTLGALSNQVGVYQDEEMTWYLPITIRGTASTEEGQHLRTNTEAFYLRLRKEKGRLWRVDSAELEALIGLWTYFDDGHSERMKPFTATARLIDIVEVPTLNKKQLSHVRMCHEIWIQRRSTLTEAKLQSVDLDTHDEREWILEDTSLPQPFGWQTTQHPTPSTKNRTATALFVLSQSSTLSMCAQDIYIALLAAAFEKFRRPRIDNETTNRVDPQFRTGNLLLENTLLRRLAEDFEQSGIGSEEDAYACIVPVMLRKFGTLGIGYVFPVVRAAIEDYRTNNAWEAAEIWSQWLCDVPNLPQDQALQHFEILGQLYHLACRSDTTEGRAIGFKGIHKMLQNQATDTGLNPARANIARKYGWLALRIAAFRSTDTRTILYTLMLQYLLGEPGLNLNQSDEAGRGALSWAAEKGHYDFAALLIRSGADPNWADRNQFPPLVYAAERRKVDLVALLLKDTDPQWMICAIKDTGVTLLMIVAEKGYADVDELFLERLSTKNLASKINIWDYEGNTALMRAGMRGQRDSVQSLLKEGADANIKNNEGGTVLHLAATRNQKEVVQLLLGDVKPLWKQKHPLIKINESNIAGRTALMCAVKKGYGEMVQILLDGKADVNLTDYQGRTALHLAVDEGHRDVVELLLLYGTGRTADAKGITPWSLAKNHHWPWSEDLFETLKGPADNNSRTYASSLSRVIYDSQDMKAFNIESL